MCLYNDMPLSHVSRHADITKVHEGQGILCNMYLVYRCGTIMLAPQSRWLELRIGRTFTTRQEECDGDDEDAREITGSVRKQPGCQLRSALDNCIYIYAACILLGLLHVRVHTSALMHTCSSLADYHTKSSSCYICALVAMSSLWTVPVLAGPTELLCPLRRPARHSYWGRIG